MTSEKEHDRHEQAAYEAALRLKREREVREEMARYKRNLLTTLPSNTQSDDFEGCIE